jgi:hypothetical protein
MSNKTTRLLRCAALLSAAMIGVMPTVAQVPPQPAPQGAPAPAYPDFATVTKGMQVSPGLLTLFQANPADPTHDSSKLLAQIPRGLLNQDLLLAATISRGEQAGLDGNDYMIRFQQQDKRVMILVPDTDYISKPNTTAADLVNRTHTPAFLGALPIVTMTPNGDPVVDLGSVALGSLGELPAPYSPQTMGFGGIAGLRRDLSRFTNVKSFPDNVVLDVDLAFMRRDGSGENLGMSYAIRRLPPLGSYAPRLADERVGYFATVQEDWAAKHSDRENLVRYIYRWDLKKKDPTLEMSPPEKPITFVIEKTVPLQWRKYVADGVLEWNKAFEKIGISNAMVVEQQTDDNEFANVDPEDARYNFIRWMISGEAYAMAMFRVDPRTGQLLNTQIVFDDSMLRAYNHEFEIFGPGPAAATLGTDFLKFLTENPKYLPLGQSADEVKQVANQMRGPFALDDSPTPSIANHATNRLTGAAGSSMCNYGAGMQRELEIGNVLAGATGRKIPERLVGEVIKETISHEVGHTLGLRHNFKASSWLSLDEIKRRRDTTDDSMSASVMDYNPTLFFANDDIDKVRHFISPTIGPYDYWAIEYGYRIAAPQDGGDKELLTKITSQSGAREHAYATDEDTTSLSPDPLTNRYDMGSDPLGWAKARMDLCDSLLKDIAKWGERKEQPRHYLLSAYGMVMSEKARNMLYVSRVPTGEYFNRNRLGDADAKPPIELLDPKQQRAAIKLLSDTIFNDKYFPTDPDLLNELVPTRDWGLGGYGVSLRVDYPIHQSITALQSYVLLNLCTPYAMQRIYDAELKSKSDDKFTAAELLTSLRDDIWSELQNPDADKKYTDTAPMISSIRRNLQRQHLAYLLASVQGRSFYMSPDLQSMVRQEVKDLGDRISDVLAKNKQADATGQIDFATRAHLSECRDEIDRALDVQHVRRVDN